MAIFVYPPNPISISGIATEAKQDVMIAELQDINTELDAQSTTLSSIDGKVATETTLASLDSKVATETTLSSIDTKVATEATLASIDTKVATETTLAAINSKDFATETTLSAISSSVSTSANQATIISSLSNIESDINDLETRLAGALVPETFDHLDLTYVASGNGQGEVETVVYKTGGSGGATVATLTLAYDGNNNVSSVTRS